MALLLFPIRCVEGPWGFEKRADHNSHAGCQGSNHRPLLPPGRGGLDPTGGNNMSCACERMFIGEESKSADEDLTKMMEVGTTRRVQQGSRKRSTDRLTA